MTCAYGLSERLGFLRLDENIVSFKRDERI